VCLGVRCEDGAAEASESHPGSSWNWEDCHICYNCVSPVQTGQWVRQIFVIKFLFLRFNILTMSELMSELMLFCLYNQFLEAPFLFLFSPWCMCAVDQFWCVLPVILLWTSWLRRLTRPAWKLSGCVLRAGRPSSHQCLFWHSITRSATWTGQWNGEN